MNETQDLKMFKSFSRNLNKFLNKEGIYAVNKGVHTTGIQISPDNGKTWEDYTSVAHSLDKYYMYFSREDLEGLIKKSFEISGPVFGASVDGKKEHDILIRKRVRYFEEFEINDRLQLALKRWKESGPRK